MAVSCGMLRDVVLARDIHDLELLIAQPLLYPSSGYLVWSDSHVQNFTELLLLLLSCSPMAVHLPDVFWVFMLYVYTSQPGKYKSKPGFFCF